MTVSCSFQCHSDLNRTVLYAQLLRECFVFRSNPVIVLAIVSFLGFMLHCLYSIADFVEHRRASIRLSRLQIILILIVDAGYVKPVLNWANFCFAKLVPEINIR